MLKRTRVFLATLALSLAAVGASATEDLWFHVKVQEHKGDNANVTINLPISFVESALSLVPADEMQDGRIKIDDAEFDAAKLRELWRQVQNSPDATYVTVTSDEATVHVAKERGYLVARTDDNGTSKARVNARIPLSVVEALLSSNDNTLNVSAALRALADEGEGEIATVTSDDANVRVWIDSNPEAR